MKRAAVANYTGLTVTVPNQTTACMASPNATVCTDSRSGCERHDFLPVYPRLAKSQETQ